jgi:flagellar M-ring protein FliF
MQAVAQTFRELNQVKIAALVGAAIVLIGFFIFLSLRLSTPAMSPLFTSVPPEEAARIVQELETQGTPYQLRANGTQILAPTDQVDRIRLQMADLGLPSSGSVVGYEIFDSSDVLGTSNFVLNINQIRALEGELSRTISNFDTVDHARVHLVLPRRELFTRDSVEPTASVALKLRSAGGLNKREIAAIRHLVATAVPGLSPTNVTVVDSRGQLLAKGGEEDAGALTEEAEGMRASFENRIRNTVERLLEQSIGTGKVTAEVFADIDFDRIVRNREIFDPEGQVARSVQSITETENENETDQDNNVTVGNQLPDAQGGAAGGSSLKRDSARSEETTNFEISKEVINSVKETGTVKRLSVAVLVDGIYAPNDAGELVYQPRSEEELEQLTQLVRSAIGYDESRGDEVSVINMQFAQSPELITQDDPLSWLREDLNSIIQTLVLGGVAVLAILLVIRPLVARAIESAELVKQEEEEEQAALGSVNILGQLTDQSQMNDEDETDDMINIDRVSGKVRSSSYNRINGLVEKHPEETMQIIRQWIMG